MAQFVLVLTHPPDQCPTANSKVRELFQSLASELPKITARLGVKVLIGPLISTEHKAVVVLEAEKVERVRDFTIETAIIQWNSVEILPCVSAEEAAKELQKIKPIY